MYPEHGLITSQFDAAPKPGPSPSARGTRLITSQFDTAPKREVVRVVRGVGLITSQFDTAPKLFLRQFNVKAV